jgi:AcrR family transcriptional regulator
MPRRSAKPGSGSPNAAKATPYQRARDAGRQALAETVLRAAGELLMLDGAGGLTMRKIADHIGASTTVLYSVFDSKNAIIDAMVQAGHDGLRSRLLSLPDSDPMRRLAAAAHAYRHAALEDSGRYGLMFGNSLPSYQPSEAARQAAAASFDTLASFVAEAMKAGALTPSADPAFVAEVLIASAHGAVSLELSGHFDDGERADERFAAVTAASITPFLAKRPERT